MAVSQVGAQAGEAEEAMLLRAATPPPGGASLPPAPPPMRDEGARLEVTVHRARGLSAADRNGYSDPYARRPAMYKCSRSNNHVLGFII